MAFIPFLSTLGTIASIAGAGVGAAGALSAGAQANAAAKAEAKQMEMKAAEDRAVAQRQMFEERRQGDVVRSNMIAAAAAGGGSTEDPGILDMLLDAGDVAEMNARNAKYQGEVGARNSLFGAQMARLRGRQAKTAGYFDAGSSVLSGFSSYAQKYG